MRLAQRLDDQENIADVYKLLGHMYLKFHCFETGGGNSARAPHAVGSTLHLAREWSLMALNTNLRHNFQSTGVTLDLARQEFLLGEEDDAIAMLELYLTICVHEGRNCCEFCWQVRGEDAPMETCGGCGVARYCSREHQELSFNKKTTRLHTFSHKIMCPLWKRGRNIKKGKETAEDCRQYFLDFLASLNTLTVDGKKRQEGREVVVGGKNIPQMVSPDEACVGGAGGQRGQRADSIVSQKVGNQTLG